LTLKIHKFAHLTYKLLPRRKVTYQQYSAVGQTSTQKLTFRHFYTVWFGCWCLMALSAQTYCVGSGRKHTAT